MEMPGKTWLPVSSSVKYVAGCSGSLEPVCADVTEAERMLRSLVNTAPADEGRKTPRITFCYTVNKAYLVYRLPQTTLFKQLTSFVEPTLDVYAAFYGGRLLLAPDEDSLSHLFANWIKGKCLMGQWLIRRAWITCPIHIILC